MGIFSVWQSMNSWGIINYQAGGGAEEDGDGVPIKVHSAGGMSSCTYATLTEMTLTSVKYEAHDAVIVATCRSTVSDAPWDSHPCTCKLTHSACKAYRY